MIYIMTLICISHIATSLIVVLTRTKILISPQQPVLLWHFIFQLLYFSFTCCNIDAAVWSITKVWNFVENFPSGPFDYEPLSMLYNIPYIRHLLIIAEFCLIFFLSFFFASFELSPESKKYRCLIPSSHEAEHVPPLAWISITIVTFITFTGETAQNIFAFSSYVTVV